ncbi:hypothetical protein JCM11491_000664 [Sporobolomyces phaffii]
MASSLPTPSTSQPGSPTSRAGLTAWVPTPLHPDALELARTYFDVIDPTDARAETWYDFADAAIVTAGKLSTPHVERAASARLRIVTRNGALVSLCAVHWSPLTDVEEWVDAGVGTDSIPLETCRAHAIAVTNQPGCNAQAVAELALGLAIAVSRKLAQVDRTLTAGRRTISAEWRAPTVQGKTLGLVGMGDIARETAKKFHGAFDTPVVVYSPTSPELRWTNQDSSGLVPIPHRRVDTLDELLAVSDIVSLHCPLNDRTRGIIGEREFGLMKSSAIILNTARGGLIDEPALARALRARTIYGAGIDTLEHEPPTLERYPELLSLENILVMPHIGAQEEDSQRKACIVAVETAYSYLTGRGIGQSKRVV